MCVCVCVDVCVCVCLCVCVDCICTSNAHCVYSSTGDHPASHPPLSTVVLLLFLLEMKMSIAEWSVWYRSVGILSTTASSLTSVCHSKGNCCVQGHPNCITRLYTCFRVSGYDNHASLYALSVCVQAVVRGVWCTPYPVTCSLQM